MKVDINVVLQPNIVAKAKAKIPYRLIKNYSKLEDYLEQCYELPNDTYTFVCSNNVDVYSSSSNKGIIHTNLKTGISTTIYTENNNSYNTFFEDSKGNVYATSTSYTGLIQLKGSIANKISDEFKGSIVFYENSKGNVYVVDKTNKKIYLINDNNVNQIGTLTNTYQASYIYEDSKGRVYLGAEVSFGLSCIDGSTVTTLHSQYGWLYFFEDSKGNVYFKTGGNTRIAGIFYFDGNELIQIDDTLSSLYEYFEDSKGNVYFVGETIKHLNGTVVTQIYENTSNAFKTLFEDSKGNVYLGSTTYSNYGIIHLDGLTVTKITTDGYSFTFFEDTKGNVYATSDGKTLFLDGANEAIRVNNKWYNKFYEDSKGNVYAYSSTQGIYYVNGSEYNTLIYDKDKTYKYFTEFNNKTFVAKSEKLVHRDNVIILDEKTYRSAIYIEEE